MIDSGFVFDLAFVAPLFLIGIAAWIRIERRCDQREAAAVVGREPYAVVNTPDGLVVVTSLDVLLPVRDDWSLTDVLDTVSDIETFTGIEAAL